MCQSAVVYIGQPLIHSRRNVTSDISASAYLIFTSSHSLILLRQVVNTQLFDSQQNLVSIPYFVSTEGVYSLGENFF
jgi:hypothetical protein